ncbi:MAG: hypothetical protein PSV16_05825 [Flavobacterium sp.]|nr:hypothetical protein [Flavobacterium sp.]
MKKFKNFGICAFVVTILSMLSLTSCNNDDGDGSGKTPVIESVSASVDFDGNPVELTPTTLGYADNVYIIHGSGFTGLQKVYFNETDTYFNPTLVTDTDILVTIDRNTPYANTTDQLKIVTASGEATFGFTVAPPAPLAQSYNPINAQTGDIVTIYGSFFLNPTVTVGTTDAVILSSTETEIKFELPAGSEHDLVTVTTISGSSTASQPIGTAIYDDAPAPNVENYLGPWDGSGYTVNTEYKVQGASSIQAIFTGYTGFKFPMYGTPASTTGYSGIRVSFKSTKDTGKFKVVINGNYGAGKEVPFTSTWTSFVIPFSELGYSGTTINEIVFQEYGNDNGDKLYIDDVGFVLQ